MAHPHTRGHSAYPSVAVGIAAYNVVSMILAA
jgi:hypothetical protein